MVLLSRMGDFIRENFGAGADQVFMVGFLLVVSFILWKITASRLSKTFAPKRDRGFQGEDSMANAIAMAAEIDGRPYFMLRNLYVPARAGTTELDAVLLHETGIYVFESKNLSGEISGTMDQERWRQYLNEATEHTFHNPVLQNRGHIAALRHYLRNFDRDEGFVSVIVFGDRSVLRKVPQGENFCVVKIDTLEEILVRIMARQKALYTSAELKEWHRKLKPCVDVSAKVKAEHKAWVQNRKM